MHMSRQVALSIRKCTKVKQDIYESIYYIFTYLQDA